MLNVDSDTTVYCVLTLYEYAVAVVKHSSVCVHKIVAVEIYQYGLPRASLLRVKIPS